MTVTTPTLAPTPAGRVRVCVFCGASSGRDPRLRQTAEELGHALAAAGLGLVFGAGKVGMMRAVSDGALAAGGEVIGVIPQKLMDREKARADIDLRVVPDMHERKALMYELSDAFVTLPGGLGTLDEFFETATWSQLGYHAKPSFVLNAAGYYDPLRALLDHATDHGFLRQVDRDLISVVDGVPALVDLLTERVHRPSAGLLG